MDTTSVKTSHRHRSDRVWHAVERCIAAGMIVTLSPVIAILAFIIKLESRGPVLFRQTRRGMGGAEFHALKFRSMNVGAERHTRLGVTGNSSRITRVGRVIRATKLDEIPQLWNIVIGQMRFVGPRPLPKALDEALERQIPGFTLRYQVYPGLTSLAQVCVSDNQVGEHLIADWSARFEVERRSMQHRGPVYDLVVIALTAAYVVRKAVMR